jgi:opacity protein-like surface antigen
MKNTLLAIALATASLAAVPAVSFAADNSGGFFVNGNVGQSSLDKGLYNDDDTGYGVNAGYRWTLSPNVALGLEGGYTDLGKFDPKNEFNGLGFGQASVKGFTAGVNGHFNLTPQWYLSGRAGLFRADTRGWAVDGTTANYVDETNTKYYAGAGFGYDFSNNFSVGLNYDYYKTDKNQLSVSPSLVSASAEYRF